MKHGIEFADKINPKRNGYPGATRYLGGDTYRYIEAKRLSGEVYSARYAAIQAGRSLGGLSRGNHPQTGHVSVESYGTVYLSIGSFTILAIKNNLSKDHVKSKYSMSISSIDTETMQKRENEQIFEQDFPLPKESAGFGETDWFSRTHHVPNVPLVTIGNGPGCMYRVDDDPYVSRLNSVVMPHSRGTGITIADMGSTNGTAVIARSDDLMSHGVY